jgi:ABC-type amino acid transport substrate-binding protein
MRILIYSVLFFLLGAQFLVSAQVKDKQQIIKVGVYDNPPKIFMNKDGYPDGIFIDILKTIAGKENLKVEYTFGEWSQLLVMLRKGEIDVLPDVAYSQKRACVYSLSQPVLSSWLQVFTTRETVINTINNLQDKKIGVLKTSIQEEYLNNRLNGETELGYKIFTYDDYNNSIKALKNHDIDLIVANRFFYFSKFYDNNLLPTSVILDFTELHFAFTKDVNDNLVNIFDKNIISMKNNPKSDYYISLLKWFNKDYEKKIPKYIFIILIAIILFFLVVVVFALMLNYKIKEKTKILHLKNEELTAAKEKAEEHDKLKTVFLQNMSHEIRTPMNAILGFLSFLKNPELDEKTKMNI